jgi:hypothetical protein
MNDRLNPLDMEKIGYFLYMEEQERKQEKREVTPSCATCIHLGECTEEDHCENW